MLFLASLFSIFFLVNDNKLDLNENNESHPVIAGGRRRTELQIAVLWVTLRNNMITIRPRFWSFLPSVVYLP